MGGLRWAIAGVAAAWMFVAGASCAGNTQESPADAGTDSGLIDATQAPETDANVDANVDAPPAPRCDPNKPFGTPALVPGLELERADVARLTSDEKTIYFGWNSEPRVAERSSPDGRFGPARVLADLEPPSSQGPAYDFAISKDGRSLFFSRGGIWKATRPQPGAPDLFTFGTPEQITFPPGSAGDRAASPARDGTELFFTTTYADAGPPEIRIAHGPTFADRELVPGLIVNATNGFPTPSADGETLFFGSDRPGTRGPSDIWFAKRASDAFGLIVNASSLNSDAYDVPVWLAPDGCRLYLVSDRPSDYVDPPRSLVWVAQRPL